MAGKIYRFLAAISPIVIICSACVGASFVAYRMDKNLHPPDPGYTDWLDSTAWDVNSISNFLGVPIPTNAVDIQFEGHQGQLGSDGVDPELKFSFHSPPQSALSFINAFCNGLLHPGYNPLKSIDSYLPSSDAFLIRGGGSIHYSKSPGVPKTTFGNRCARGWWLEEFAVDESDPYSYLITYRLPYEPNVNPAEFYDMAQRVAPLDRMFRLYVTGLREERSQANRSVLAHESSECELYLGA